MTEGTGDDRRHRVPNAAVIPRERLSEAEAERLADRLLFRVPAPAGLRGTERASSTQDAPPPLTEGSIVREIVSVEPPIETEKLGSRHITALWVISPELDAVNRIGEVLLSMHRPLPAVLGQLELAHLGVDVADRDGANHFAEGRPQTSLKVPPTVGQPRDHAIHRGKQLSHGFNPPGSIAVRRELSQHLAKKPHTRENRVRSVQTLRAPFLRSTSLKSHPADQRPARKAEGPGHDGGKKRLHPASMAIGADSCCALPVVRR